MTVWIKPRQSLIIFILNSALTAGAGLCFHNFCIKTRGVSVLAIFVKKNIIMMWGKKLS